MKKGITIELPSELASRQPIVLFDDECNLCNRSVRFLIRHNKKRNLSFSSLRSKSGSTVLRLAGKNIHQTDTLLLMQDNMLYGYSTAALKISSNLDFPLRLAEVLLIVPALIRDTIYRFIAKNRYKWFGKKSFCNTDAGGFKDRFLF